jgi:hypothetical protein
VGTLAVSSFYSPRHIIVVIHSKFTDHYEHGSPCPGKPSYG